MAAVSACTSAKPPVFDATRQQEVYSTPQQALEALAAANRRDDTNELLEVLGPHARKLLSSGDEVADKEGRKKFLAAYDAKHTLERVDADKEIILIGKEEWPLPIPIVHTNGGWSFDTGAGEDEILNRRIGRNELNVIKVCYAYVNAQQEYATLNDDHAYAQKLMSSRCAHDGLYWPVLPGGKESPLGPLIAHAQAEGYLKKNAGQEPYHGYYYKILKRQGAHAAGGAMNYVEDGYMDGGFALLAFPAVYGDSGIMTFMVNQDGIIYGKDLGPRTGKLAPRISTFNPDESWKIQ